MPSEETTLLAQLAAELQSHADLTGTVDAVVNHAADVVPGSEHVSLTVRNRGGFLTLASTSPVATGADEIQYALNEGPCIGATVESEWFLSPDIGSDARWPRWGPRAAALGLRSLVSVPLLARGECLGALNMYSTHTGRFEDGESLELAMIYALHVAYAVSAARKVSGLEIAMGSRHVIGVAQGILMERHKIGETEAFAMLRRVSSHQNRKLRDVASDLVYTGLLVDVV